MNFLTEHLCFLCLQSCPLEQGFCKTCFDHLMILSPENRCIQCANILPEKNQYCGKCIISPPAFDATTTLLHYDEQAQFLLQQFKYYDKLNVLDWLLPHMLSAIQNNPVRTHQPLPNVLIPVPLHRWRLLKRGFNQSTLIARGLSKGLNIPLYPNLFTRHRSTKRQSHMLFQDRKHNIVGAFSASAKAPSFFAHHGIKHIAIIDDVMTTGATAQALAELIKRTGQVDYVEVWTLMRA